jgi:hypothetical protein
MMLRCEYDNLIKLREICEEIVDPGPFCCTPTILALWEVISTKMGKRFTKKTIKLLTSQVLVTSKSSTDSNKVYGFWCGGGSMGGRSSFHIGFEKY